MVELGEWNDRNAPTVWYALRRTLPAHSFERNLDELIVCLPRYEVDEVIVPFDRPLFVRLSWS
jgi:hypothetical protein